MGGCVCGRSREFGLQLYSYTIFFFFLNQQIILGYCIFGHKQVAKRDIRKHTIINQYGNVGRTARYEIQQNLAEKQPICFSRRDGKHAQYHFGQIKKKDKDKYALVLRKIPSISIRL